MDGLEVEEELVKEKNPGSDDNGDSQENNGTDLSEGNGAVDGSGLSKRMSGAQRRKIARERDRKDGKYLKPRGTFRRRPYFYDADSRLSSLLDEGFKRGPGPNFGAGWNEGSTSYPPFIPNSFSIPNPFHLQGWGPAMSDCFTDGAWRQGSARSSRPPSHFSDKKDDSSRRGSKRSDERSRGKRLDERPPGIKKGIVLTDYPDDLITEEQCIQIQEALLDKIATGDQKPQFRGIRLEEGTIQITCSNEETKKWLENVINDVEPWPGAKLMITEPLDDRLDGTKMCFTVPPLMLDKDKKLIVEKIEAQNGILSTQWKQLQDTKESNGHRALTFVADDDMLKELLSLHLTLYLGFGTIRIRYFDK